MSMAGEDGAKNGHPASGVAATVRIRLG
jgi:hypothetical protein